MIKAWVVDYQEEVMNSVKFLQFNIGLQSSTKEFQ